MEFFLFLAAIIATVATFAWFRQSRQISRLQQQLAESAGQHRTAQDEARRHRVDLEAVRDQVTKCDALLMRLRHDLASQDGEMGDLRARAADLDHHNQELRQLIARTERESIQSKALFSTLASVAYDIVFVLDEDNTIIALNRSAETLFAGRNPIGEKLLDLVDAPDLHDIVERAVTEPDGLEEQLIIDNRFFRVRTQIMRYVPEHFFIGIALQDITQLVRLNRARRDMVANISHELRTPIANIRLIIDSLFHEDDRPKRKASIASLRDIARETDSLLHLVQELLDLSMIESGQAIMKLLPNNLAEMVDEVVERLFDQLEVKKLRMVRNIPDKLQVLCDSDQTRRVLMNLIRNAIGWSPHEGIITISAIAHDEEVMISIFDQGPGVPDDQRERIFERFYRVDTARSGSDGSGLGLAICKHIVEAHGGRVWAEGNSQGAGGRFFFTLLDAMPFAEHDDALQPGQHDSGLNMLRSSATASPQPHADSSEMSSDFTPTEMAENVSEELASPEQTYISDDLPEDTSFPH